MKDENKTKKQLLEELAELREQLAELTAMKAKNEQAEIALRESEKKHRLFFKNASIGIIHYNNKGIITDVNDAMVATFGSSRNKLVGLNLDDIPDKKFSESIYKALDGERGYYKGLYTSYTGKKKAYIEADWIPIIDAGKVMGGVGIVVDITDRKQAEAQIRTEKEFTEKALNAQPDTFFLFEPATCKALRWNRAFREITGFTDEEIAGLPAPASYYSPVDLERTKTLTKRVLEGETGTIELELICKDGSKVPFEYRVSTINDDRGKPKYLISIGRDITDRKRAEETLRESELRLLEAQRIAKIGSWDLNLKTNSLFWSDEIYKIFDIDPEIFGATYESFLDNIHPDDRELVNTAYTESVKNKIPYKIVHRLLLKGGAIKYVEEQCETYYDDETGDPVQSFGTFQDITERVKAEDALQIERDNLSNTFQALVDGIYIVNQRFEIQFVHKALEKDFGPWKEGDKCYKYFHARNEPCTWCKNQEVWEGKTVQWEWYSDKNDKTYELVDTPITLRDGSIGKLEIFRDITDRKLAESKLERLNLAIEQLAETVVITDKQGTILYVNPAFEKISGYSLDEALGQNPRILQSGVHDSSFYEEMWDILLRKEVWRGQLVNKKKDGTIYTEEATISPVLDASGEIVNFVAVKRDITEDLKLQEQLRQTQKMEAVGTLAGGIAHDFNNLLTGILGHASLLKLRNDPESKTYDAAKTIEKAAERAAELTAQLLGFARKGKHQIAPVNIHLVIPEVANLLSRTIDKNIKVTQHLDSQNPIIKGDPAQIQQALLNLALNARDAMPNGGELSFQTEITDLDEEYCRTHLYTRQGRHLLISVTDTGKGISAEIIERIFEPFFTTKEEGKGTGMGLAMVYGIVKNHDGHINVYSEVGEGTTFKLYLPLEETDHEEQKANNDEETISGSGRILIVDDEAIVRTIASDMLIAIGYEVITANNGVEAVEIYKNESSDIDLVILDMIMPEMGGHECFKELKKINPDVKAILSTGFGINGKAQDILEEGVKSFVQKPYRVDQLSKAVAEIMKSD
jgi:PAS domain S-box-containing protein